MARSRRGQLHLHGEFVSSDSASMVRCGRRTPCPAQRGWGTPSDVSGDCGFLREVVVAVEGWINGWPRQRRRRPKLGRWQRSPSNSTTLSSPPPRSSWAPTARQTRSAPRWRLQAAWAGPARRPRVATRALAASSRLSVTHRWGRRRPRGTPTSRTPGDPLAATGRLGPWCGEAGCVLYRRGGRAGVGWTSRPCRHSELYRTAEPATAGGRARRLSSAPTAAWIVGGPVVRAADHRDRQVTLGVGRARGPERAASARSAPSPW